MGRMSRIAVICSNYNGERWIDDYLEAINSQLLQNFEIIFVDANSTDKSIDIIEKYEFRDGIVKTVIRRKDKLSIYAAWNLAIENTDAEYVININTDDRLYPLGLYVYDRYTDVYPNTDIFYSACNIVKDPDHNQIVGIYDWPEHSHEVLLQMCLCGPFPLVKKSTLVEMGMYDEEYTISGDYKMWLTMSKANKVFMKIPGTLGSYFYNPDGMSTNMESEHWQEHLRQDAAIREEYK